MATNQDSSPQLSLANVPDDFCPPGGSTWAAILNLYQTKYLSQAIINIPGLGLVTPQEIARINETLISLQNQIDAITQAQFREGVVSTITGDNNYALVFTTPLPNANYDIYLTFYDALGTGSTSFSWGVVSGSQAASGITVRCYDITAAITSFKYRVVAST